jgi:hypothetical protein
MIECYPTVCILKKKKKIKMTNEMMGKRAR